MKKTLLIASFSLFTLVALSQTTHKTRKPASQKTEVSEPDPDYDFKIKPSNDQMAIDTLKKLLLNKILWIKYYAMDTYDPVAKKYGHIDGDNFNLQPVKIVDVDLSGYFLNPYRIFLQDKTGTKYFYDFEIDPGKKYGEFDNGQPPYGGVAKRQHISNWFYSFNPVLKYHLTAEETNMLRHGDIKIGMRAEVFRLIKGEPTTINFTEGGAASLDQWVYDKGESRFEYYYFSEGRLKVIQD